MKKKSTKHSTTNTLSSSNVILISKGTFYSLKSHTSTFRSYPLRLIILELNFEPHPNGDPNIEIISLRHPRTGDGAQFLYNSNDGTIQELWKYSEKFRFVFLVGLNFCDDFVTLKTFSRSWFIGNSVNSEGTILFSTNIDPLFLILPLMQKVNMSSFGCLVLA